MAITLTDLLDEKQVILGLRSRKVPNALREIVELLAQNGRIGDPEAFFEKVLAILCSSMPIVSSSERMTEFISSALITPTRALSSRKQPFSRFAACVPSLERPIWPSRNIFIGHIRITIERRGNWLLRGILSLTNREFLFCLVTSIAGKVIGRNRSRK
jgi:hypothetical protein